MSRRVGRSSQIRIRLRLRRRRPATVVRIAIEKEAITAPTIPTAPVFVGVQNTKMGAAILVTSWARWRPSFLCSGVRGEPLRRLPLNTGRLEQLQAGFESRPSVFARRER